MAKDFQDYKATVGEGDDATESVISARVSDGGEEVSTLSGPRQTVKGDVVIKSGTSPNTFDVLDAKAFESTGYKSGSAPAPVDSSVDTGGTDKTTTRTGGK